MKRYTVRIEILYTTDIEVEADNEDAARTEAQLTAMNLNIPRMQAIKTYSRKVWEGWQQQLFG